MKKGYENNKLYAQSVSSNPVNGPFYISRYFLFSSVRYTETNFIFTMHQRVPVVVFYIPTQITNCMATLLGHLYRVNFVRSTQFFSSHLSSRSLPLIFFSPRCYRFYLQGRFFERSKDFRNLRLYSSARRK